MKKTRSQIPQPSGINTTTSPRQRPINHQHEPFHEVKKSLNSGIKLLGTAGAESTINTTSSPRQRPVNHQLSTINHQRAAWLALYLQARRRHRLANNEPNAPVITGG